MKLTDLPASVRAQFQSERPSPKRHKYGAVATVVDGRRFDSKREAKRFGELKMLEQAGEITGLELQPKFVLHSIDGVKIGEYRADFRYRDKIGAIVVEDAKGFATPLYRWKRKHVEGQYGIKIVEV